MPEEIKREDHGKILMSWNFPEHPKYKRTFGWYLGMAIIVGLLLLYAITTTNFLFIVIIIIVTALIISYGFREPQQINFNITEDGLEVGSQFYPWVDIKSFWIIYQPPEVKTLYFNFRRLAPILSVALEDQNPVAVREILLRYLKEDLTRERELAGDELSRWLKI